MTDVQMPVMFPTAGATVGTDGVSITADYILQTPTFINEQLAELIPQDQGFYANRLLKMPGITVKGGAMGYREVNASNVLFLNDDGNFAPRAPGAASPSLDLNRRPWKFARTESMSLAWEVADEVIRWNQTTEASDLLAAVANSFADRMNTRAVQLVLAYLDYVNGLGGNVPSRDVPATDWSAARPLGVPNADPKTLPTRDFRAAKTLLVKDKTGVANKDLIMVASPDDVAYLDIIFQDRLEQILKRYNIVEIIESPIATVGQPVICVDGGLGYIAFDKMLETEEARGTPGTWKKELGTECAPVFVVNKGINAVRLNLATLS